jgi:hypothetical protein
MQFFLYPGRKDITVSMNDPLSDYPASSPQTNKQTIIKQAERLTYVSK